MSKIIRTEPGSILSKAVEYHGFVYLPGITARDTSKDIKGQTADILEQIDQMLETHGTDKTRLLQALIWVKHIKDRAAMNELWTPVAAAGWRSRPRLRAGGARCARDPGRDHGDRLQVNARRRRLAGAYVMAGLVPASGALLCGRRVRLPAQGRP